MQKILRRHAAQRGASRQKGGLRCCTGVHREGLARPGRGAPPGRSDAPEGVARELREPSC
ncbi:MAG: hypothetical protein OJF60_000467 [Burkholderiaceae bacterium]|nr:MAG: hypothetical protein OJF60_000467 [Burkholderiaceae bacterium]